MDRRKEDGVGEGRADTHQPVPPHKFPTPTVPLHTLHTPCTSAQALQRFKAHPLVTTAIAFIHTPHLHLQAFKIAIHALTHFLQYASILYPQIALFILSEIILSWSEVDPGTNSIQYIIHDAVEMIAEKGVLSFVVSI